MAQPTTIKYYKVTFWRGNPQLKNGGYYKEKLMRGKSEESVMKRASQRNAGYGSLTPIEAVEITKEEAAKADHWGDFPTEATR